MRRSVAGGLLFTMGVGLAVVGLKAINWFPGIVQRDLLREYGGIQEARGAAKMREVLVPSYFPQDIQWPPSRLLAQGTPYPALLMEFRGRESRDVVLVISQAASDAFVPEGALFLKEVAEKTRYALKGRDALVEIGPGRDGVQCARISWREGPYRVRVLARSSPYELIKVAESMLR